MATFTTVTMTMEIDNGSAEAARTFLARDIPRLYEEDTAEGAASAALAIGQWESFGDISDYLDLDSEQVGTKRKEIMASIHDYKIDTSDVLHNPSRAQLKLRIERLSPGLWKIGQCYMDKLDVRSHDSAHYSPEYFHRDGAVCLAYGMTDTQRAAVLETTAIKYETTAIKYAKFDLHIGVNTKSRDDVAHDGYSPERVAAIYAVPVRPDVATTQEEFRAVHVSYYMERTHGGTTKEERKAAKRAQLLDQLIAAIPMQQLQRAFESPTSPVKLWKLQRKHGFKESNVTIYTELRAIFDEQY